MERAQSWVPNARHQALVLNHSFCAEVSKEVGLAQGAEKGVGTSG